MRKIKIIEHISLDGVISPGGPGEYGDDYANGGWTAPYRSPAGAAAIVDAQGTGFDLLLGRRTYDLWADYWPKVKGGPFAEGLNAAKKYVVSKTIQPRWNNTQLLEGNPSMRCAILKRLADRILRCWAAAA